MTINLDRRERIILKVEADIADGAIITGGHFILDGSSPKAMNEGTLESFSIAVSLYSKLKNVRNVKLGILLNDIGQTCGSNSCSINSNSSTLDKNSFSLPSDYLLTLEKNNVGLSEIHIFWEKHIRNRGKKLFHRIKNNFQTKISTSNSDTYFTLSDGEQVILLRGNIADKYGTPACPLIMAAYAMEQSKISKTESFNIYYVNTENIENIPNHLVIEKGAQLASEIGCKLKIKNVYVTSTGILKNYQII